MDSRKHTVLITGASGQVGGELLTRNWPSDSYQVTASDHVDPASEPKSGGIEIQKCNFSVAGEIEAMILKLKPDLIINPAAYTDVEGAESQQDLAFRINSAAVEELARAAQKVGSQVIHISTDYVYAGCGDDQQSELAELAPHNVYGASKLAGDQHLLEILPSAVILRTSWIYRRQGKNFANTILKLAAERPELKIIDDQRGAPTSAIALVDAILAVAKTQLSSPRAGGVYNCCCRGEASWFDFATYICQHARHHGQNLVVERLLAVPSSEFATKAQRPLNSRMNINKFESTFGFKMPDWKEAFDQAWPYSTH